VLGLLLRPLLHRTGAVLRQQDVRPIARHHRMAFNNERIVGMGRQAVLHPVPLAQRNDDQPGYRLLVRVSKTIIDETAQSLAILAQSLMRLE
jgi:hypothetical protein